jgi:hypothetical protein
MTFRPAHIIALVSTSIAVLLSICTSAPIMAADLGDQAPIEVDLRMEGGSECQRFVPESLTLEAGRLYKLRLINQTERSCYFSSNKLADAVYTRKVVVKDGAGKDAAEEKINIEKYKKEYADYWKEMLGMDGDFELSYQKEEE